jgi:hypothetical protein
VVTARGEGDLAQFLEGEDLRPGISRVPRSGAPALTSATAWAMSAEAIGWTSVAGSRTVVSSEVHDSTEFTNAKNCVERTSE